MESRVMSFRKRAGARAASTARRYPARVRRGVTPRFVIAICRTAATRSAISATVKPSGKMIRRRASGFGAAVVGGGGSSSSPPATQAVAANAPAATTTTVTASASQRVTSGAPATPAAGAQLRPRPPVPARRSAGRGSS